MQCLQHEHCSERARGRSDNDAGKRPHLSCTAVESSLCATYRFAPLRSGKFWACAGKTVLGSAESIVKQSPQNRDLAGRSLPARSVQELPSFGYSRQPKLELLKKHNPRACYFGTTVSNGDNGDSPRAAFRGRTAGGVQLQSLLRTRHVYNPSQQAVS